MKAGCWQKASGSFHESLSMFSWQLASPEGVTQERVRWKSQFLLWLDFRSYTLSFLHYIISFTSQPDSVWEGTRQQQECWRHESLVALLDDGYQASYYQQSWTRAGLYWLLNLLLEEQSRGNTWVSIELTTEKETKVELNYVGPSFFLQLSSLIEWSQFTRNRERERVVRGQECHNGRKH